MSQALINGTAYEIDHGNTLISGTSYTIEKGNTLISGTAYEIILKEEETVNYEDYYLNLTPHQNSYYTSTSMSSFSLSDFGENGLTDGFDQIDTLIWKANSNGGYYFYRKMGQQDAGEYLPLIYRDASSSDWWSASANYITTGTYYLKKAELEAGSGIKIYWKSGNNYTALSSFTATESKIYVEWHDKAV